MGSFRRYVWLFVANHDQISLGQHSFELLTFSRFHLSICYICLLAFGSS